MSEPGTNTELLIARLAERLNITPVKARQYVAMKEAYAKQIHLVTVLRPHLPMDASIILAMGWDER